MASSSSTRPIDIDRISEASEDNGYSKMTKLVAEAKEKMPIKRLKRYIAAELANKDPGTRQRLYELGEDPEKLRAEFKHTMEISHDDVMERLNAPCMTYHKDIVQRVEKRILDKIQPTDGWFAIKVGNDYWGDGWPDSPTPDICSKTTELYLILKIVFLSDGSISFKHYLFEIILKEENNWGVIGRESEVVDLRMRFLKVNFHLNLYELLALYPKLYERLVWTCGGPKGMLEQLRKVLVH